MSVSADYNEILTALRTSVTPGDVIEIRQLHAYRGMADTGYFNDPVAAANAICAADHGGIAGTYYTMNPVNPDVLARAYNRMVPARGGGGFAVDGDVVARKTFLIDVDPKRASGISSTEEEHTAAIAKAQAVASELEVLYGWPAASLVDSGNGCHVKYRTNMPNDEDTKLLMQNTLKVMSALWGTDAIDIDKSVFNASRICRLPGTVARKGDNMPTRPHRVSRIMQDYDAFRLLTRADLEGFLRVNQQLFNAVQGSKPGTVKRWWYPDDEALYKALNAEARQRVHDWVPVLYQAHVSGNGYRIRSADIGQDWEEDVAISPEFGIKHFGVADQGDYTEGKRTAVSFIAETLTEGDKRAAALKLSEVLNKPATPFDLRPMIEAGEGTPHVAANGAAAALAMPDSLMGVEPLPHYSKYVRKAGTLADKHFDPVPHLVQDMITEGTTLLSADPKAGKSFFALQLSICLAFGIPFLGKPVQQQGVFYMGLEEDEANFKDRMIQLCDFLLAQAGVMITKSERDRILNENLFYYVVDLTDEAQPDQYVDMPTGERGLQIILGITQEHPHVRTVVVDTLQHFKPEINNSAGLNAYEKTYKEMQVIAKFQKRYKVNFIALHHNKKGTGSRVSDDFMQDGSGSQGLPAAVDTFLSLKGPRPVNGQPRPMSLSIGGRRMFDSSMNVQLMRGSGWIITPKPVEFDPITDVAETPDEHKAAIKQALDMAKAPLSVTELMKAMGLYSDNPRDRERNKNKLKYSLQLMVDRQQVHHIGTKYGYMEDFLRQGGGTRVPTGNGLLNPF